MPYAKVIVNPAAGAGKTAKCWPEIMGYLQGAGLDFDYHLTTTRGEATELAKSTARLGYGLVVSVGGDGTLNEVANGLFSGGCLDNVALGIVSTGTGSDYIRSVGVPRDYREACKHLTSPNRLTVDLGTVECVNGRKAVSRVFLNSAGVGLDAEMVQATTGKLKFLGPRLSYLAGFLTTLISHENTDLLLRIGEEEERMKACIILVSNGRYGGGGMRPAPDADPGDGLFDVLVVGNVSRFELLRFLPRMYRGTHLIHPKVQIKRATEVEILPLKPLAVEADGELLGETPVKFKIIPKALQIVT